MKLQRRTRARVLHEFPFPAMHVDVVQLRDALQLSLSEGTPCRAGSTSRVRVVVVAPTAVGRSDGKCSRCVALPRPQIMRVGMTQKRTFVGFWTTTLWSISRDWFLLPSVPDPTCSSR